MHSTSTTTATTTTTISFLGANQANPNQTVTTIAASSLLQLSPSTIINNNAVQSPVVDSSQISFLDAPQLMQDQLNLFNKVWVHCIQDSAKDFLIQNYLSTHGKNSIAAPVWIHAGNESAELLTNWFQAIKTIYPNWKNGIPPNYLEILDTPNEKGKYLFIIEGIKVQHLGLLRSIANSPNQKWIFLTSKKLHQNSINIKFDKQSVENWIKANNLDEKFASTACLGGNHSFSSDPLLLSIATETYKFHGNEFLNAWNQVCQKPIPFVPFVIDFLKNKGEVLDFSNLLLLGSERIKKDFFKDISFIKALSKYKLVHDDPGCHEYFIIPSKIREGLEQKKHAFELSQISTLSEQLHTYAGFPLQDEHKWIIPHAESMFKLQQEKFRHECVFQLFALLWSIGHTYTQTDHAQLNIGPFAAKNLSIIVRNAIEEIVIHHCKKGSKDRTLFLPSNQQKLVESMNEVHPYLAHLYVNLQYQIGRCYFYIKAPVEAVNSKILLQHAKGLAEHLYQGKTLLSKLIERNGLIFHLSEEKKYGEAIKQYQNLIDADEAIDIRYHDLREETVPLKKDPVFRMNCFEYYLNNLIKLDPMDPNAVNKFIVLLEKELSTTTGPQRVRPLTILVQAT